MNKAILSGRLTRDPIIKTTKSQIPMATFTMAVERLFKSASGERQTDFILVVAWRNQADFVQKYFKKGSRLEIVGEIHTREYDSPEGQKQYITEVIASEINFGKSKSDNSSRSRQVEPVEPDYAPDPDDDTILPFDV